MSRTYVSQTVERLSLVFALLLVLLIALLSFRAWAAYGVQSEQQEITQRVVTETNALLSSLKDAETGQRGFLLTGDENYLQPYQQAMHDIPVNLETLNKVTVTRRPDQEQRVMQLRPLIKSKLDEMEQTIDRRRASRPQEALAIVETDRGKILMDQIRAVCAEIQTAANKRLNEFSRESRASANEVGLIGTAGAAALFVLLVFSSVTIHKGTQRRQQLIEALERSEKETKEARDWLETTIGSIGDGVIATDAEGRVSFLNPVAQSLTGWEQEHAAGKRLDEIFVITNEETGATVENPVTKALREGRVVGLANHTKLTQKNGRQIPIDDSAAPIRNAAGHVAGVVLVFRDVSDRKEAETAVEASMERYRHLFDYSRAVMNNMAEGLYTVDREGLVTFINPVAEKIFGWSGSELMGKRMHDVTHYKHPDGTPYPASECPGLQVLRDGTELREFEDVFIRKDGSFFPVVYSASTLVSGGETIGVVVAFRDDTERQKAEAERAEAERQLRRANEDLNQFAFAASHDLQEPLRMITSYSQLLVKGYRGQLAGEASVCVEFINEGTKRMRDLLGDLLAYTQLNGDRDLALETVSLNVAVQKAIENCKAAIEETEGVVTSEPLPVIPGHEPHFVQLFQNLISNAIKYRDPARAPRVQVGVVRRMTEYHFSVKDNGMGIDPEYHQKIFGVFKRLHGRMIPGTGIGLAICQRVVERYGGRIWVESQLNQGATFYFTIPIVEDGIVRADMKGKSNGQ